MKTLIHDLNTAVKYLYPCFSDTEATSNTELTITTETYLKKLYPIKMSVAGMKSIGEDYWGRYTFKDETTQQYYCELDGALYFKGNDPDGEPHYPIKKEIIYSMPEVDKELSEFKPFIEKAKKYFSESDKVELVDFSTSVQEDSKDVLNSKIICVYKVNRLEQEKGPNKKPI
jgi:hypothetical protein